ncbi:hypothetical protein STCU_12094 [Strigomonas culicis]|uniref:CLU central domain-containing protein n=1 Tax=Strigomonas culicis TaxID=28005 RepID=S9TBF4_9TRYP|nr:hypothetical protein STCU_12094 [Strigomonas culicis]|eukprot:EPY15347.1 hypothetical protein STCU_12094 [Strigomonas culicis]
MEVYEALDGRCYVTNSNATLTPLFANDTIMKRQEMLRLCPLVTEGPSNTLAVLDSPSVQDAIMELATSTRKVSQKLRLLCDMLHHYGVNLCLLKQVHARASQLGRYTGSQLQALLSLLAMEMIARTVKQEFYTEVQGKRVAYDDMLLTKTLSKYLGAAFTDQRTFQIHFLERLARKYGVVDEDDMWIAHLSGGRMTWKLNIVDRVSALLGATLTRTGAHTSVRWQTLAVGSVIPRLVDPQHATQLALTYQHVRVEDSHWYAFCVPLCWRVSCWQQRFEDALRLVRQTASVNRSRAGYEEILHWVLQMHVCRVCFLTRSTKHLAEGRELFTAVRAALEGLTCRKTQGRLRIEYAFALLDVCSTLTNDPSLLRSCVEEAAEHFYAAISLLPSYLKSEHGAWLHLQPYMGLLQCKKLLPSCSIDTNKLVQDSIELSNTGWASDFFIQYLWALGLQLEHRGSSNTRCRSL